MEACEKYRGLLMGLIDDELTPEETGRINQHRQRCNNCREEYEQLRQTTAKIKSVSFVEPQDEVLARLWKTPYSRFTRNSGLFLVLGGWVALIFYGFYEFLISRSEPVFPKIALAALLIGFFVLLFTVIRERIQTYKIDPYKEVKR